MKRLLVVAMLLMVGSGFANGGNRNKPQSLLDSYYFELRDESKKRNPDPAKIATLLGQIATEQETQLGLASLGIQGIASIYTLQPPTLFRTSGLAEIEALQALGKNSLYLWESQMKTLGAGLFNYFDTIMSISLGQNLLIQLYAVPGTVTVKDIVDGWFDIARPQYIAAACGAPTEKASRKFNNKAITLIDYVVQLVVKNPTAPNVPALMATIAGGQQQAAGSALVGVALQQIFAANVADINAQIAALGSTPDSLEKLLEAIPGQLAVNFYNTIGALYADLNAKIAQYPATITAKEYAKYFEEKKPLFIAAAEAGL